VVVAMNATTPIFGDEEMAERTHIQVREEEANLLASREDFRTIFNEDLKEFYQLSLLLTRDPAKAERCFVMALKTVSRETASFVNGHVLGRSGQ
jgi:hypothetical protein